MIVTLLIFACSPSKAPDTAATDTAATDTADTSATDTADTGATDTADTGATDTADTADTGATDTGSQNCDLAGTRWMSLDPHECGLGPDGVALCHWRLGFTDTAWDWMHSDVGEFGTWTCADGAITGARSGGSGITGALVDATHLTWDGLPYVPEGSVDTGSGDTGSGDTGSGDTGAGDTGSVDTGTGDTGTGDTGTGDTGGSDLCAALPGSSWQSVDLLECGRGGSACHWRIDFGATEWTYVHSDVAEAGTWTCREGVITGALEWGSPTTATLTDGTHLTWAGVAYERVAR
jgi:hypothetical protein